MHAVAKELQAIWANEPVEVRNERLNAVLQDATATSGAPWRASPSTMARRR